MIAPWGQLRRPGAPAATRPHAQPRRTPPRAVYPDRRRAPSLARRRRRRARRAVARRSAPRQRTSAARTRSNGAPGGAPARQSSGGRRHAAIRSRPRSPQELHGLGRPVRREHLGTGERRRERRQPQAAADFEHPPAVVRQADDVTGERDPARPELGPVRDELVLPEAILVDQALGVVRAGDRSSCRPTAIRCSRMRLACHDEEAARRAAG